jgi:hypothetical protein
MRVGGWGAQVRFLVEAAELLGDARKVLMWTYAYAFFLPAKHPSRRYDNTRQGASNTHRVTSCCSNFVSP